MSKMVQAIVVEQDSTHEAAVQAVALASLNTDFVDDPAWQEWLSGMFTKTVRKMKPAKFEKFRSNDDTPQSLFTATSGARAYSLPPMLMDDFPKEVKRAQVSGVNFPRVNTQRNTQECVAKSVSDGLVTIVVNDELGMTTGKECAQVSHAFWIAWLNGIQAKTFANGSREVENILRVNQSDFDELRLDARHEVNDNGLTEFNHVITTTVLVM